MAAHKTYIIAEAGVNHNGDLARALTMIDAAVEAGADAVKFQSFIPEQLVTAHTPKAGYQIENTGTQESQLEMLRQLALPGDEQRQLQNYCRDRHIDFLSSPFDQQSLRFLLNICHLPCIKFGSGELTNAPLLLQAAEADVRIILSTGMSTLDEIEEALAVMAFGYINRFENPSTENFQQAYQSTEGQRALQNNVTLLHCTSEYPCPFDDVNLFAMDTLRSHFHLPVGLSDHTQGIGVALAAVARGASVIEKHFTLDRRLPGPDHRASIEPSELKMMVEDIRHIESALGTGEKRPAAREESTKAVARKHLVAARPIAYGEAFTVDNLAIKRSGRGLSPMQYWDLLTQTATRDYDTDDVIEP